MLAANGSFSINILFEAPSVITATATYLGHTTVATYNVSSACP